MALCDPFSTGPLQVKQADAWGPKDQQLYNSQDTYYLHSYWGLDSCNGAQAHSAQVTHGYDCATYDTATTDSALSDQDALACTELLYATESTFLDDPEPQCARAASKATVPFFSFSTPAQHEVRETIKNEMGRERETQPEFYFKRHDFLSKELRGTAVSWAIQVVQQFNVEQETLFLAISYLDRFLSITADVVHMDGLHLATLACLSLAAKQAEVAQPSTAEWTVLVHTNSWGTKEQLARMEWIIMENLEWRGCTPTAWWFLHLFCYGLGSCPAPAICMAAYLLELGLLEAGCLAYHYSSLAAAALMLGHAMGAAAMHGNMLMEPATGGAMLTARALLELAPELNLHQVQDACGVLAELHARACLLPEPKFDQAVEGLQLVRGKFSTEQWHHVGLYSKPVDLKAVLERF